MESSEIKRHLDVIEQQVSSPILGGMEDTYNELAAMGYVIIHEDDAHPSAIITPKGEDFLANYTNSIS